MIKLLYKLFPTQFNQLAFQSQEKQDKFSDYKFSFIDTKGKKYYEPVELDKITLERFGTLMQYIGELDAALSRRELKLLFQTIREAVGGKIEKGQKPDWAMVGFIVQEYEDREKKVLPKDVMYAIIATYYVRQDENPQIVDDEIHSQKVEEFQGNIETLGFFLKNNTMTELLGLRITSPEQLDELLEKSQVHAQAATAILKRYISQEESSKKG